MNLLDVSTIQNEKVSKDLSSIEKDLIAEKSEE